VLADYKNDGQRGEECDADAPAGWAGDDGVGIAPDETVQAAVAASKQTGVWVVVEFDRGEECGARAKQVEQWGVNMVYLHYGADQRRADASGIRRSGLMR